MRLFRLIQTYPGSPKKGYILETGEEGLQQFFSTTSERDLNRHWKELLIKDFTVVSVRNIKTGETYSYNSDFDSFVNSKQIPSRQKGFPSRLLLKFLSEGFYEVHSLLRNKDKAVFTIGDRVKPSTKTFELAWSNCIIESFQPFGDCTMTVVQNTTKGTYSILEDFVVCSKVLTTEDGVDIYPGDKVYWLAVNEDEEIDTLDELHSFGRLDWSKGGNVSPSKNYKWFSNIHKLEEYLFSIKMISVKDVFEIINKSSDAEQAKLLIVKHVSM